MNDLIDILFPSYDTVPSGAKVMSITPTKWHSMSLAVGKAWSTVP
jgi:hypothetical protein